MATGKQARATARKKPTLSGDPLCTFCGKDHTQVAKLVGGPGVYICNQCVGLCNDILASHEDEEPIGWQGWCSLTDEALLTALPGTLRSAESVREDLQARIDELRRREVSWARIGQALGMSRQAAWERFA